MRQCQQAALKDSSEFAERGRAAFKVECQAFTRDGGGADFTIYVPR